MINWGSIAGIAVALAGLWAGQVLEGGQLQSLLQWPALLVVLLGTLGAVLLQTEFQVFVRGVRMLKQVFVVQPDDRRQLVVRIQQWSQLARKEGVFAVEQLASREKEPYIRKGLQLLMDNTPPDRLREICAIDLYYHESDMREAIRIWSAAGGYAPTVGIIGAVLGLIHVMENLSDPARIGSGIAVAFVSTLYGVALANLLFLPIANKLKSGLQQELARREMLMNAWVAIARGDHPNLISERISAYLKQLPAL